MHMPQDPGADRDTTTKDQGARASSNAEWTAAFEQTAQQVGKGCHHAPCNVRYSVVCKQPAGGQIALNSRFWGPL